MKYILLVVLTLSYLSNFAQGGIEISGKVIDKENVTLPFANVGIVDKNIGASTTEDGDFLFVISDKELQDTIYVSYLGYVTVKIKVQDYLKQQDKKIILESDVETLDEVVISNIKPRDYALNALERMKENTLSDKHQIDFIFRYSALENGKSKFYAENYIKLKDRGPFRTLGPYQVAQARKSADYRIWKRLQPGHAFNIMPFENPFRPSIKQRDVRDYKWEVIGDTSYEDEDVIIIKGFNTTTGSKWDNLELYVGYDTYKVYKIKFRNALYLYKKNEKGRMYLSYYRSFWANYKGDQIPLQYRKLGLENVQYKLEAFVYKVETDKTKVNVKPYGSDLDISLIKLPYNYSFWLNLKLPPPTKFYKKIKSDMESVGGISLENQYKIAGIKR